MPDGTNTKLIAGLVVLTAISIATAAYVRRSRLRSAYLGSPRANAADQTGGGAKEADRGDKKSRRRTAAAPAAHHNRASRNNTAARGIPEVQVQRAGTADVAVVGQGEDAETDVLPSLLTTVPPCWQDPTILGWNKLRARPTLGAFSSVDRARCEAAPHRIEENNGVLFVFLLVTVFFPTL